ncbi:MAG TPA: SDR family oxidoreductase [Actinomycetota bacterium]|nr:SDR family oxidoreductase [Actinomycetota bacterium]
MQELVGKVALVTGAAMGIGRAAAQALADQGAKVALVDREEAEPIRTSVTVRADVSTASGATMAVASAVDAFGRLDIAVCAAGIQRYGSVVEAPEDQWDEVLATNLKQMFLVGKHAIPHMEAAGEGAIVNVASVQALVAQRGVAAYAASKGGVVALTRAMAVDHAPLVRVNCVCPGSVDTPMLRWAAGKFGGEDLEETVAQWGEMHPLGRVAEPREIAETIAFLAGPRASFVTGAALVVDGGLISRLGGT